MSTSLRTCGVAALAFSVSLVPIRAVTDDKGRPLVFSQRVSIFEDDPMRQVLAARVTLNTLLPPAAARRCAGGDKTGPEA